MAAGNPAPYRITNVNSHSLGVAGVAIGGAIGGAVGGASGGEKPVNAILIKKNSALPIKATRSFVTKVDDQRSIVIRVLEGESRDPKECSLIGHAIIRDLPAGLRKGHRVQVTYEYQSNGRLCVEAARLYLGLLLPGSAVSHSGQPHIESFTTVSPWGAARESSLTRRAQGALSRCASERGTPAWGRLASLPAAADEWPRATRRRIALPTSIHIAWAWRASRSVAP